MHFAMGLAHRTLANGAESTEHLEIAAQHGAAFDELHGQILRSLAFNYAQSGKHQLADATIADSIRLLGGQERDLSKLQQAFMLLMRGEHRAALPVLTDAVAGFSAAGQDSYLALTLYNRALVHMEFGDYDASVEDLERAYEIGIRLGHHVSAADAALHLSQALGWRDDVPGAMRWHARSVELRTKAQATNPVADTEHAFVLIQARLMREAEAALRDSIPRLVEAGDNHAIAVAGRLLLADVMIERGDHDAALAQLELASAESPADGRWRFDIAAAHHRARMVGGERTRSLLNSMIATAAEMEANGEVHPAAVERCRATELALERGDIDVARELGEAVRRHTSNGPLWLQIQAWTAVARLQLAERNQRGAAAAARAGMRRLDDYRGGIGATDLRLHAGEWATALGQIGIEMAVSSGSPSRVLSWSERLKGTSSSPAATSPEIETALTDLRRAAARARVAEADEVEGAIRSVRQSEVRVSALTRQARRRAERRSAVSLDTISANLHDRALIEYVQAGPDIHAVVVDATAARLVRVAARATIADLIDHLRLAAERIARPTTSDTSRLAAIASATEAASVLRRGLINPLGVSSSRLVIISSGVLHGVPWGLVCDVPTETAPSADAWINAVNRPNRVGETLVVQGPGLDHAPGEVAQLASRTGGVVTSTVSDTIERLGAATQAHFACHARPRTDSPMFSSLVLDDGELTLHDIEHLDDVPSTIVLATCAGGSTVLASGDEVVSLAGSFLAMGARTVVAPLFTVSDQATATAMGSLHAALATGTDPAAALLSIRNGSDPEVAFTAGSFNCFGTT